MTNTSASPADGESPWTPQRGVSSTASSPEVGREGSGGSQTLQRGLRVLTLLASHPNGLTVSEISTEMTTHRAGIYRLLRPLESEQLVERRPNGAYVLGLGLISLAANVKSRLQEIAARELQQLADEFSSTCALTVPNGDEGLVVLVQEPAASRMHIAYRRGLRHPLTQGAAGLAILASDERRPAERDEVARARELGYAVTRDELFAGATGVAVPILGGDSRAVGSISIVWLGEELEIQHAAAELQRRAAAITQSLADESTNGMTPPVFVR